MTRQEFRDIANKAEAYNAARKQAEAEHGLAIMAALRHARSFGAEAKANGRKFMSTDDRSDIAGTLGVAE